MCLLYVFSTLFLPWDLRKPDFCHVLCQKHAKLHKADILAHLPSISQSLFMQNVRTVVAISTSQSHFVQNVRTAVALSTDSIRCGVKPDAVIYEVGTETLFHE